MRLVLLGLPGAGKGTQGELLTKELNVPHISSGNIFRSEIETKTELGKQALTFIGRGELVPDDVSIQMIQRRLAASDCLQGFILDGFPRTVSQARALDAMSSEHTVVVDAAVHIKITKQEACRRIVDRLVCGQCEGTFRRQAIPDNKGQTCPKCRGPLDQRKDDTQETVEKRLQVYEEQTMPVVEYYRQRGSLVSVDGLASVDGVFRRIVRGVQTMALDPSAGVSL